MEDSLKRLNKHLNETANIITDNIKFQYEDLQHISYNLNSPVVFSGTLKEYINIVVHSKKDITIENDNTVYININPLILNTEKQNETSLLNIINRHLWILVFKHFLDFFITLSPRVNSFTIQDNYICKKFYERIKHLPIFKTINKISFVKY
jgi:hypothetical protein